MKKLLLTMLLCLPLTVSATDITLPVLGAYDGDTIYSRLDGVPSPLNKVSIRIVGIDTPEIRGKCQLEKDLAQASRAILLKVISTNKVVIVKDVKWDKYGGRVLGRVFLEDGTDVRLAMINSGLARPYSGGFRKDWCK